MSSGTPGRAWLAWPGLGLLATIGYFLMPPNDAGYVAIGLLSAVGVLVAVRRHRPRRPAMWYWIGAGMITWVLGDVTFGYYTAVLGREPFPSPADALYLAAYPMLFAGLIAMIRSRGRDPAALLDAGIIATGLGLVLWSFVMQPIADNTDASVLGRVIGLAYPAADVLVLALLVRILTAAGVRTASYWLLVTALLLLLASDVSYSLVTTFATYSGGAINAGWLLGYVFCAAAAAHPSMRSLTEPGPQLPARLTRRRLFLLGLASLLAPALLLLEGARDPGSVDWLGIGLGAVALFLLVVTRMSGLTAQVQRQASQLRGLALRDDLTGLPNRRAFEDRIRHVLNGPAQAAQAAQVALLDLDDFKAINDRLGHAVGDQLIVAMAARLSAAVRPTDLVARLGGDEFVILLADTDDAVADELIGGVVTALRRPLMASQHQLLAHASAGVANAAGTTDPFEVLRRADVAMYSAKDAGGNQYVRFRPEMDERAREYARLGARLRSALDEGQFELVYQPIVGLPHGRPVAAEALLRWRHPRFGLINPLEFVPIAERNGLIVPIGAWVLRQACAQAVTWRRRFGPAAPRRITVNVSARQLAEPDFPAVVADVLARTGLPADALAIEITETAVFNGGQALAAVHAVHGLGVRIALDDFGTGHSSLGLLHSCPVDILKVDRSFVEGITGSCTGRDAVIVKALISVSRGLNITAVAEGVETAIQAEHLHRIGYRYAQGYHFGRPMPAAEMAELLTAPIPHAPAA